MDQAMIKEQREIRVEGTGQEKKQAFAEALNKIHNQVLKKSNDVTVRIEPLNIQIIRAEKESFTERFLFIFLPRLRTVYKVELLVTVEITCVVIDQVDFVEKKIADPNGFSLFQKNKCIRRSIK